MNTNTFPTVTLIGYGLAPAKPAQDLIAGDIIIWNYGYKSTVVSVAPRGRTQLWVEVLNHESNTRGFRVMGRTTLVAMKVTL